MKAYLIDFNPATIERCAEIAKKSKLRSRNQFIRNCVVERIEQYNNSEGKEKRVSDIDAVAMDNIYGVDYNKEK